MTDETKNPENPIPPQPRRTGPTIDLSATEVKPENGTAQNASMADNESKPSSSARDRSLVMAGAAFFAGVVLAGAAGFGLWTAGMFEIRQSNPQVASSDDSRALAARLAQIEKQLRNPQTPVANANDAKLLADLTARLNRLETASAGTAKIVEDVATLRGRADEIADGARAAQSRAEAAATLADSAQQSARANNGDAARSEIEALTKRLAMLEQNAKTMNAESVKRGSGTADDRTSRLAVAASALRLAVERGEPFGAELDAAKALSDDTKLLKPLEAFAAKGIPSQQELARELSGILPAMQKAAAVPNANAQDNSILQKLRANAERLVRVRPVGDVPGDDAASILARIGFKAAHADIDGALIDMTKLPPAARTPADAWMQKAQSRVNAIATSRDFARATLAALGKSAS